MKKWGQTIAMVVLGNIITALAVVGFVLPTGLVMGGATGIGITINRFLPALDIATSIFLVNTVLFVLGFLFFGKVFALSTIVSSVVYPVMIRVVEVIPNIDRLTENTLLSTLYAGILLGLGIGLIIRAGSSTGGSDIIALILNRTTHLPVSVTMYLVDFAIIGLQIMFCTSEQLLYGILALILTSMVIGRVTILGQAQTQLFIISKEYKRIKEELLRDVQVGVTMMHIETGLEEVEQSGVLCVIPQRKLFAVKEKIQEIDPKAFITITRISEVRGRGFTLDREYRR